MTPSLEERRRAIVAEHGPWIAHNLDLGDGCHTMAPGLTGVAETRVARIARLARELLGDLDGASVLDIGCHEGGFAVALAERGADVLAIDGRPEHVAKARFAAEALGLERMRVELRDMRTLDAVSDGTFDLVLCLGVLYHLDAPAVFEFAGRVAALTRRAAIVETQFALRGPERREHRGREYRGMSYGEDTAEMGASLDNPRSFWLTRPSLLNLLADSGFGSVLECAAPAVPILDEYADHTTLVALPAGDDPVGTRHPEAAPRAAHPAQGPLWALRERIAARRGRGLPRLFTKWRG